MQFASAYVGASEATDVLGAEGDAFAVVLTRTAGTDGAVAVDVAVQAGHAQHTAVSDVDFTSSDFPATVSCADGADTATVSVTIPSDGTPGEGCDVLALQLVSPSRGAWLMWCCC